jgi:AcrR family transcriptional regulator
MAGRKQFDVDKALDAAMRTFWRHGYAETSLDLLGRETGLGRGSLYGTFGDKDALFRQALGRYGRTWGEQYDRALAAHPGDPRAAVRAFFDVIIARLTDPAVPDGCLVVQSASQSPLLSPESAAAVRAHLDRQRERIRAAVAPSCPDPDVVEDLALFVSGVNQSLAVSSRAGMAADELRSVARTACRTVDTLLREADERSATGAP